MAEANRSADRSFGENTTTDGMQEKLISVTRTAKVVKGGRVFGFSVTAVAGDGNGKVGLGTAKGKEVPNAIKKAFKKARTNMVYIPLKDGTLQHQIVANHGASKVFMKPASEGTGIIAGGAMRAIFEVVGVRNVLSKCIGSSNPINVVRATLKGLTEMATPDSISSKRNIAVNKLDLVESKEVSDGEAV